MEVIVLPDADRIATLVADAYARRVHANPATVLGLATGSSPLKIYRELIRRCSDGLSFGSASAFLLDEYIGIPRSHEQSYYSVIRSEFTDQIDISADRVFSPNGEADDIPAESERYDRAIADAGGVDIQLLGIGTDGHVGFNEPGSSLASRTRIKTLTEQTRDDNARFFSSINDVPRHVLTQGLGTILEARKVILVAMGAGKAEAVAAAVEGPLSAFCPASVLQLHPNAAVIVDEAAGSALEMVDYYKNSYFHKPDWQKL